jgi:hypothetical protein
MLLVYGQCYQLNFTSYTECPKSTENYAAFVKALELRYGDHHLSQVYLPVTVASKSTEKR